MLPIEIQLKTNHYGWNFKDVIKWIRTYGKINYHWDPDKTHFHLFPFTISVPRRWFPAKGDGYKQCANCGRIDWIIKHSGWCEHCTRTYGFIIGFLGTPGYKIHDFKQWLTKKLNERSSFFSYSSEQIQREIERELLEYPQHSRDDLLDALEHVVFSMQNTEDLKHKQKICDLAIQWSEALTKEKVDQMSKDLLEAIKEYNNFLESATDETTDS
jgi:hypothetical protein